MLRVPVIVVFVLGVLATVGSAQSREEDLGFTDSASLSNQVPMTVILDAAARRVRLRATLDTSGVTADAPTTPGISADIATRFDAEALALPARVRAGMRVPEEIDDVDVPLLTFFSPAETARLGASGDVVDLLLLREDDGAGIVFVDVVFSGDVAGEGDIDFGGTFPVLSVVRVVEDDAVEGEGED